MAARLRRSSVFSLVVGPADSDRLLAHGRLYRNHSSKRELVPFGCEGNIKFAYYSFVL